jgi:hypothetical protein
MTRERYVTTPAAPSEAGEDSRGRAESTLRALRAGGYRTGAGQESVGQGILLHHDGDGADLVLYPDGSVQPVGSTRRLADSTEVMHRLGGSKPSLRGRLSFVLKVAAFIAVVTLSCFLAIAFWLALLDGF